MLSPRRIQRLLYALSGTIAVTGVTVSAWIYRSHSSAMENLSVTTMTDTKLYRRGLEMYGGKMNVLFDDFGRWFASLWQGENLAFSLAILALLIAAISYVVARNILPSSQEP